MIRMLDNLRSDHLNFAKLLGVIGRQANLVAEGTGFDLEILTGAVEYLENYPTRFHHPLENAICEQIRLCRPEIFLSVEGILREHAEVDRRLAQFREAVVNVQHEFEVGRSAFAHAAFCFVRAERDHIEREETEFFPVARQALGADHWNILESAVARLQDPLFGPTTIATMERLRRQVLEWDDETL